VSAPREAGRNGSARRAAAHDHDLRHGPSRGAAIGSAEIA
jgi:hypothetical protein